MLRQALLTFVTKINKNIGHLSLITNDLNALWSFVDAFT